MDLNWNLIGWQLRTIEMQCSGSLSITSLQRRRGRMGEREAHLSFSYFSVIYLFLLNGSRIGWTPNFDWHLSCRLQPIIWIKFYLTFGIIWLAMWSMLMSRSNSDTKRIKSLQHYNFCNPPLLLRYCPEEANFGSFWKNKNTLQVWM